MKRVVISHSLESSKPERMLELANQQSRELDEAEGLFSEDQRQDMAAETSRVLREEEPIALVEVPGNVLEFVGRETIKLIGRTKDKAA